ncbi:hypothetical protein V8E36_007686 [Tilletia maclaganii]
MSESDFPMGSDATNDNIAAQAAADAAAILAAARAMTHGQYRVVFPSRFSFHPGSPSHKKQEKGERQGQGQVGQEQGQREEGGQIGGCSGKDQALEAARKPILLQTLLDLKVNEYMPAGNFKHTVPLLSFWLHPAAYCFDAAEVKEHHIKADAITGINAETIVDIATVIIESGRQSKYFRVTKFSYQERAHT